MLNFKQLELADKTRYEGYTLCHGYHNIEASFANIFLWRNTWNIKIATDESAMYVIADNGKDMPFMLPPFLSDCEVGMGDKLKVCEAFYQKEYARPLYIKGVTQQIREAIEKDCPGEFEFTPDRSNFEYVYLSEDLISLRGKKYHAKRNHINKLVKNHQYEYKRYMTEHYDQCIALQQQWIKDKGNDDAGYSEELAVTKEALQHLEELNLRCGLLFVDGALQAFSIGEKFGDDMAIIHIEKANPDLQGTYPLINREFVANEWCDVKYINREEDMGLEGLRKAKLSYNPVFLLEKFDCVRK